MADSCQRTRQNNTCKGWAWFQNWYANLRADLTTDTSNIAGQNINSIYRLRGGHFVIMCTDLLRFYIGEVLDIYKQGTSSRYGSVDDAATASGLSYLALRVYLHYILWNNLITTSG